LRLFLQYSSVLLLLQYLPFPLPKFFGVYYSIAATKMSSIATSAEDGARRSVRSGGGGGDDDDDNGPTSTSSSTAAEKKVLYLIRHAESEENRRLGCLAAAASSIGRMSLPSKSDVAAAFELANVSNQVDSPVSGRGRLQIRTMSERINNNGNSDSFLKEHGIELVAHSPLLRAKQTCRGMLLGGGDDDDEDNTATAAAAGRTTTDVDVAVEYSFEGCRVVETALLTEKTPSEWVPGFYGTFAARIAEFERWARRQPETRIVAVGHSQFFKAMLGLDFKFNNCDVWRVELVPVPSAAAGNDSAEEEKKQEEHSTGKVDADEKEKETYPNLPPQWTNLERLYACDAVPSSSPSSII